MQRLWWVCLLVGAWATETQAKVCVVEGKAVDPFIVVVQPEGGAPLAVHVSGVAATAKIPEAAGPVAVEIRAALGFSGTVSVEKLPLKNKTAVNATNAMLRLGAGVEGFTVHARGKWVEGDVVLAGARFKGVIFPCDVMTL